MTTQMTHRDARSTLILVATLMAMAGFGCNKKKDTQPATKATQQTIVVYTDRGKKFLEPIAAAFTKKSGIQVTLHTAGSMEILTRAKIEGASSPCNIFLSKDSATMEKARVAGLFHSIDKPLLEKVPAQFRANNGEWVGISARMRVIVYNTSKFRADDLQSVFDLAKPEHEGNVGTVKSDNGSFISGITSLLADHGRPKVEAFLKGLKRNSKGHVFPKHTPTVKAVADGKIAMGYVNHYYYYRHLAKNPKAPIGIIFPDQSGKGASWNVAGVALTKHSKDNQGARDFIAYLVSDEGQQLFAERNFEYPIRPGVKAHDAVKPRTRIKLTSTGVAMMGKLRAEAVALIQDMGLD